MKKVKIPPWLHAEKELSRFHPPRAGGGGDDDDDESIKPRLRASSLWGSSHQVYGEVGAPQGPTRCAPGAPLLGQYCLLWGEKP